MAIGSKDMDPRGGHSVVPALGCVLALAVVFMIDWSAPPALPFGPYYLIPISIAGWYLGPLPAAVVVAAASAGRAFALARHFPGTGLVVHAVEIGTSLVVYSATGLAVVRLRRAYRRLTMDADELRVKARKAERRLRLEWCIRRAVPSDLDAIMELTVLGAQTGDLSKDILDSARQQALRAMHAESIRQGTAPRRTWHGAQATVPLEFWVAHVRGELAGYFMVLGLDGQGGAERELHAIVTATRFRGRGVGSAMVDFFCAHYHGRRVYAACMPDGRMHRMLTQRGFRQVAGTKEGYVVVERADWARQGTQRDESTPPFVAVGDSVLEELAA